MSKTDMWIVVLRWEEYQHRDAARSKVLPWIKNETKLLSSPDYLDLSGHRRAILHGIWLEYARSLRRLRVDTVSLTRRLNLRVTTSDLEALNHAGFIAFSASRPASEPARIPAGEDGEGDREVGSTNPRRAKAKSNNDGAVFAIRTLIANGVISDEVDLETELRHHKDLTERERDELRAALPPTLDVSALIEGHVTA